MSKVSLKSRISLCIMSLMLGIACAEVITGVVYDFAYPFLNIFEADPVLGVRLQAESATRLSRRNGEVVPVRTNSAGYRGPEWQRAQDMVPGRVLLLGDSQIFGYGVTEEDSMATQLQRALGSQAEVLSAGVPTWGPLEYIHALEELAPRYRPQVVVFTANIANDWFETKIANHRRTTARDGWASHDVLGDKPTDFPLRSFVMGRSHLVMAIRSLLASSSPPPTYAAVSVDRLERELRYLTRPDGNYRSRMTRHLVAARDICAQYQCKVLPLLLPLDVQVHQGEWQKYGQKSRDLSATFSLIATFLAEAKHLGFRPVDPIGPLKKNSPGAFLPEDYHLSPKGHATVAQALAPAIQEIMQ